MSVLKSVFVVTYRGSLGVRYDGHPKILNTFHIFLLLATCSSQAGLPGLSYSPWIEAIAKHIDLAP